MDYSKKNREELIALCKSNNIKGYSGKKKEEIVKLLTDSQLKNEIITPPTAELIVVMPGIKRVVSLFAGCGGLDFGFHKNSKYTHVFINDFDEEACKTYENNFKIKPTCGDIKKIKT